MSKTTAVEELFKESNVYFKNIDKIYDGAVRYKIYIEDRGKKDFYDVILKKLYKDKDFNYEIFDDQDGKKGLIKKYFRNPEEYRLTSKQKSYFILDKDFDDKFRKREISNCRGHCFEDILEIDNFIVLRKYCIENYFINIHKLCYFVKLWCGLSPNKSKEFEEKLRNLELNTKKLFGEVSKLSRYFLFNKYFDLNATKKIEELFNWNEVNIMEDKLNNFEEEIIEQFNNIDDAKREKIKNEYKIISGKEYKEAKKIVFSLFEEEFDINGKMFLNAFRKMTNENLKEFNCTGKTNIFPNMLAAFFSEEDLVELKQDLFQI